MPLLISWGTRGRRLNPGAHMYGASSGHSGRVEVLEGAFDTGPEQLGGVGVGGNDLGTTAAESPELLVLAHQ